MGPSWGHREHCLCPCSRGPKVDEAAGDAECEWADSLENRETAYMPLQEKMLQSRHRKHSRSAAHLLWISLKKACLQMNGSVCRTYIRHRPTTSSCVETSGSRSADSFPSCRSLLLRAGGSSGHTS